MRILIIRHGGGWRQCVWIRLPFLFLLLHLVSSTNADLSWVYEFVFGFEICCYFYHHFPFFLLSKLLFLSLSISLTHTRNYMLLLWFGNLQKTKYSIATSFNYIISLFYCSRWQLQHWCAWLFCAFESCSEVFERWRQGCFKCYHYSIYHFMHPLFLTPQYFYIDIFWLIPAGQGYSEFKGPWKWLQE